MQAGLLQNPTLSGGLALPVAGAGVETGFDVGVVQDFLGLFLLGARKKIAGAELEAAKLRVGNAVLRVTYDVQSAYDALVAAQQVLEVRRTALDAGDIAAALAEAKHTAGNISDLDLVNERTRAEQLRVDLARSAADALTAREALTRLLGLWGPDVAFRVPSKLADPPAADPPLDHLEDLAIRSRLDLASAHAEVQALAARGGPREGHARLRVRQRRGGLRAGSRALQRDHAAGVPRAAHLRPAPGRHRPPRGPDAAGAGARERAGCRRSAPRSAPRMGASSRCARWSTATRTSSCRCASRS